MPVSPGLVPASAAGSRERQPAQRHRELERSTAAAALAEIVVRLGSALQLRDEVKVPGRAAIPRKELLEAMRISGDFRPHYAHQYRRALEKLLICKLATSLLELPKGRLAQYADLALPQIDTPVAPLGMVQKQGRAFEVSAGTVGLDLLNLTAAVPYFPDDDRALHRRPGGGSGKRVTEAGDMGLPGSKVKIKVMPSVPNSSGRQRLCRATGPHRGGNQVSEQRAGRWESKRCDPGHDDIPFSFGRLFFSGAFCLLLVPAQ